MIKSYLLHTSEIDDVQAAVADLRAQLEKLPLMKHSAGIMVCHFDFVTEGVAQAVMDSLPFPVAGITSFYQRTPGASGLFELTVTVLTSDDVRFALAGCDEASAGKSPEERIREAYRQGFEVYGERPALVLNFLSVNRPVSGDEYLRILDDCSDGVPSFGAVTTGDDEAGQTVYVMCGGTISTEGFAMLMLVGDVQAGLYCGNYSAERLLGMTATVTEAEGERVKQLNGQPALGYLRKSGFVFDDSERDMISTVPFLFKPPGGEELVARTLAGFDDTGALRFLGEIPEGAILRVSTVSMEDILEVSRGVTQQAVAENAGAGLLLVFSCLGRYITLGLDPTSEMESVVQAIPPHMPYLACYVGGEICPVGDAGHMANRYHNASFIVCALG